VPKNLQKRRIYDLGIHRSHRDRNPALQPRRFNGAAGSHDNGLQGLLVRVACSYRVDHVAQIQVEKNHLEEAINLYSRVVEPFTRPQALLTIQSLGLFSFPIIALHE